MRDARLTLLPLAGPGLQLSLLAPFLVLVLLFFAITPAGSHPHHFIQFPRASNARPIHTSDGDLWLSLPSDGLLFIDAKCFPPSEFLSTLRTVGLRNPQPRVVLRADRAVPFRVIRFAIRGIHDAGLRHVFLVTFEGCPIELMVHGAT